MKILQYLIVDHPAIGLIVLPLLFLLLSPVLLSLAGTELFTQWRVKRTLRATRQRRAQLSDQPDLPQDFGWDFPWLAIPEATPTAVAESLGLQNLQPANWRTGLNNVHFNAPKSVFISPPVNGWTFVVFRFAGAFGEGAIPTGVLERLSGQHTQAHFYVADTHTAQFGWAKAVEGNVVRAYLYSAAYDHSVYADTGPLTPEEIALGLDRVFRLQDEDETPPTRAYFFPRTTHVKQMAAAWSIDPVLLGDLEDHPGVGLVGGWRV